MCRRLLQKVVKKLFDEAVDCHKIEQRPLNRGMTQWAKLTSGRDTHTAPRVVLSQTGIKKTSVQQGVGCF